MRTVLVNFEIPPEKLKANMETEKGSQIYGLRDIVSGDCKKKDVAKFARTLEKRVDGKEYPTMNFIDIFVARDQITEMDWVYYVYNYHPISKGNDLKPEGNFRLGRACIADTKFENTMEIPLSCGDSDKPILAKFEESLNILVAVMETGATCKWDLAELNREFVDMTLSCWYWKGCNLNDKDTDAGEFLRLLL